MPTEKRFWEVALGLPIRKTFTYEGPEDLASSVAPGKRVLVPFGRRVLVGYVLGPASELPERKILPVRQVLDGEPLIPEKLLAFLGWVSRYYIQPIGEVIKTALPAGISLRAKESYRVTEKGRLVLNSLPSGSPECQILRSLSRRGGQAPLPKVPAEKSGTSIQDTIRQMISQGLIVKDEDFWEEKTKGKTLLLARFLKEAEDVLLSSRQKEVLDSIEKAGEISIVELKEKYKNIKDLLKKLTRNNLIEILPREIYRQPSWEGIEDWIDGPPSLLTENQKKAVEEIGRAVRSEKFHPFLLHGVTGSGKTEVYLQAIQEAIIRGRQALLLVPEIALTTQLVAYFRSRIESPMAVLHSGLSSGERCDEWRRIKRGLVKLAIGARSAIFAPLQNPGLIIVDEEHDPSYKQEEKVRYNARDLAVVRGKMENAAVVLGSATPSMESYRNVLEKKFSYLSLPCRIDRRPLPQIRVVDMRQEPGEGKGGPIFSRDLEEALRERASRGEQVLLFLNRRGFATFALCRDCGFVYKCPNCSVSLIYHLPDKSFRCHYCDYCIPALSRCPECAGSRLLLFGLGTQRIEEEVMKRLPQVRIGRMDRDTMAGKASHQKILGQMRRGEVSLLVGTQMITKGHDFPRVTLVGVLAADHSLNIPDFRASERTFQLLTQAAGRAGRGSLPGEVILQTYNPQHYSIQMAREQDFVAFYTQEAKLREEMAYPPFSRLINLRLEGNSENQTLRCAREIGQIVNRVLGEGKKFRGNVEVLGPTMAPLARLRGKYRCQMLLKGGNWSLLHDVAERVLNRAEEEVSLQGVKLIVDVDPVNML